MRTLINHHLPIDDHMGFSRTLIIGNCGSGKSWLAQNLSARLNIPFHDLDRYHWLESSYSAARGAGEAIALTTQAAQQDTWIMEGVYGWLANLATARATTLVFLNISVAECIANLEARGPGNGSPENFRALLQWAKDYPNRQTSTSFNGHSAIFETFSSRKIILKSRAETASFLSKL